MELLVFIDDDNLIAKKIFNKPVRLCLKNLHIGSFSRQIFLLYEIDLETWVHEYSSLLIKRKLEKSVWINVYTCYETAPCIAELLYKKVLQVIIINFLLMVNDKYFR